MEQALFAKFSILAFALVLGACASPMKSEPESTSVQIASDQQAFLDTCEPWDNWDKPADPFHIYGNTFHVGTCGISAILIIGADSHVLIDSGTQAGAEVVLANLGKLALEQESVDWLLYSHEHFDHVGGHAVVAQATNAKVVASTESAAVFASGISHPEDPQYGLHDPMTPVRVDRIVQDGETLMLGATQVTAIKTPGHSPGALSWQWESCEAADCKTIVYADSLSPVSSDNYRFSDHPAYLAQYRAGLARLAALDCDILLTPHPSHSQMLKRMEAGQLIANPAAETPCAVYVQGKLSDIEQRLVREAAAE